MFSRNVIRASTAGSFLAGVVLLALLGGERQNGAGELASITLPPGFVIEHFVQNVPGARSLALGAGGTLFISTRSQGVVYAARDTNGDGRPDQVTTLLSGLDMPNGIALRQGALYVAENSRVSRYDDIESRLDNPPEPVVVYDSYPTDDSHGWKYIAFGPDDKLYVPVGAPCNVCDPDNPVYSSITRMDPDGSNFEIYARGIRNTVGFDFHPQTGVLWFTNNGRDSMGDDIPPDTLNTAPTPGLHFGFPYCHAGTIPDPTFGAGVDCLSYAQPALLLGPHVAALGMKFYAGTMFPAEYQGQIFIAEHGSWDRSAPIGYRVTLARFQPDGSLTYEVFAQGWLQGATSWGRPVDVLVMPDGALLVSDDKAGAVYRISYQAVGG